MKKMINVLMAAAMLTSLAAAPFTANAAEDTLTVVQSGEKSNDGEKITDLDTIRGMINDFIEESKIGLKVVAKEKISEKYSDKYVFLRWDTKNVSEQDVFYEFLHKSNIEDKLLEFIPFDTDNEEDELNRISELLYYYVKDNNINAWVFGVDPVFVEDKVTVEYYWKNEDVPEKIKAYLAENNIDTSLVSFAVEESAAVGNIKGDANCDGQTDMADVVLVMQALANPDKYGENGTADVHLTAQGKLNGDMDGDGLTVGDAQAIQRKLLGLEESDAAPDIDNSEYLFGGESSSSDMLPQRLALNCASFCANGETLKVKMLMGDNYSYNQKYNGYPNFDSEGHPEYRIFAAENFNKLDDERLIINGEHSEFTKAFSKDDMTSMDISRKEGDYSAYYGDTAEIDFSNYEAGSTGCIVFRFGWKADGENPLNASSDFIGAARSMYFYVGEKGTGISNNGIEAAQKAYEAASDNDIMFYDSPYLKWNGKEVMSNLYEKLRKPTDEVLPINFRLESSPDYTFEYNGKTLADYDKDKNNSNADKEALREAEKAYYRYIADKAVKQLDEQNIRYEYKEEPKRLVIYVTAEGFKSLTIDNVSRYGLDMSVANGLTVDAVF